MKKFVANGLRNSVNLEMSYCVLTKTKSKVASRTCAVSIFRRSPHGTLLFPNLRMMFVTHGFLKMMCVGGLQLYQICFAILQGRRNWSRENSGLERINLTGIGGAITPIIFLPRKEASIRFVDWARRWSKKSLSSAPKTKDLCSMSCFSPVWPRRVLISKPQSSWVPHFGGDPKSVRRRCKTIPSCITRLKRYKSTCCELHGAHPWVLYLLGNMEFILS